MEDCLMRSKLLGFFLGCALVAAAAPALACNYRINASNDPPPQQSAQAEAGSDTSSQ
jgi:hypothetical protein